MRLFILSLFCILTPAVRTTNRDLPIQSDDAHYPQYHQSVPYTGEITQNIEEGDGIQEADYDPTVTQIIINGEKTNQNVWTSKKIECNPVYTQEAPYSGIFNQNISSEASGIQKLDYKPNFHQRDENGSRNMCSGHSSFTQSAPYSGTFQQNIQGNGSVGNQSAVVAPNFSQNLRGFELKMTESSVCSLEKESCLIDSAYSQNSPFTTNQNQTICENSTGHQSLTVSPNFSQDAKNLTLTGEAWPFCSIPIHGCMSDATFVQENRFSGNMSQAIGRNGTGTQRSSYAPRFAQNELKLDIIDGCPNPDLNFGFPASGTGRDLSGAYHQNAVYSNEMRQVVYPGGTGSQSSHFSPIFAQNNEVVNYTYRKYKKPQTKNHKSKNSSKAFISTLNGCEQYK